jgi:hypothetical protein
MGLDRSASTFYKTNIRFICRSNEEHAMMDIGTIFALPLVDSGAIHWTLPSAGSGLALLLMALVVVLLFEVAFPLFSKARGAIGRRPVENAVHEIKGPAPERESIDRRAA